MLNIDFQSVATYEDAAVVAAIGWGRAWFAAAPGTFNPDGVCRWQESLSLNELDAPTFYTEDAFGFTDYHYGRT